jgi:hypothetical protein
MVEIKEVHFQYDCDGGSNDSPPLVEASHVYPDASSLDSLYPLMVEVVTIDGDPLSQESVTSTNTADDSAAKEESMSSHKWAAGVAGGVVGTLLGGPLLGVVAGGAAAYYTEQEGAAGDISRALGEVATTTGAKVKELNEKHHLLEKSKQVADEAWDKVKDFEVQHHLSEKSKRAAKEAWENAKKLNKEHKIMDKLAAFAFLCLEQIIKLVEHVSGRLTHIDSTTKNSETVPARRVETRPIGQPATCY